MWRRSLNEIHLGKDPNAIFRWNDGLEEKGPIYIDKEPPFLGYLFVGVQVSSSPWRAIRSTFGVTKLVNFSLQPAIVPTDIIEELMSSCEEDGCIQDGVKIAKSDKVEINEGPSDSLGWLKI
jgi:transcriptional antiterminator RfaH